MVYTRVWDNTFPPDTQQANQLGADIRNMKVDLMQRMLSFAAGPIADRPTPDASSGSPLQGWGTASDGVMYFAVDTKQIFRWNGSSWVEISNAFIPTRRQTAAAASTVANAQTLFSFTYAAGSLAVGNVIEITLFTSATGAAQANLVANAIGAGGGTFTPCGITKIYVGIVSLTSISLMWVSSTDSAGGTMKVTGSPAIAVATLASNSLVVSVVQSGAGAISMQLAESLVKV